MSEKFKDKIQGLELENFTCFAKVKMEFSSGINVLIGENGTGKTHVLKVLYALLRKGWIGIDSLEGKQFRIAMNFIEVFKLGSSKKINDLIYGKIENNNTAMIVFDKNHLTNESAWVKFLIDSKNNGRYQSSKDLQEEITKRNLLFIPTQEMLTLYKGFIAAYEKRENGFDGTYYDLAKALNGNELRDNNSEEIDSLVSELESSVGVQVRERNNQFYLQNRDNGLEIEANLSAEGIKKLGQMIYLIRNGSLTKETILFWDEPEVNLNPRYIAIVVKFLQTLAKNGVQIFVATHDYLLAHLLSLDAEYREQTDAPPMKFLSFYKGEDGTEIESADTLAGIHNNSILDEYAAYYELEQKLFRQTLQKV
jgi:predicted ATP-dependent endonuclease of OLD family